MVVVPFGDNFFFFLSFFQSQIWVSSLSLSLSSQIQVSFLSLSFGLRFGFVAFLMLFGFNLRFGFVVFWCYLILLVLHCGCDL